MEEKHKYFFLSYVLDLIDLLEQKFYQDSNLRVKLMYDFSQVRRVEAKFIKEKN